MMQQIAFSNREVQSVRAANSFGKSVPSGIQALTSSEFSEINSQDTGIIVKSLAEFYSPSDIKSIKDGYPEPEHERRGKIVLFHSAPESK